MVRNTALLSTQHYKVLIKGKVEKSKEMSSAPPQQLSVVAIEKGAFWSPSTIYIYMLCLKRANYIFSLLKNLLEV